MTVRFDHTIVWSRNTLESATFLARVLGLDPPVDFGDRVRVELAGEVCLDYQEAPEFRTQHYALLVDEDEFDNALARLTELGIEYYSQGGRQGPHEISERNGGRVAYFSDPDSNTLELVTRHMIPTSRN